jgi:glycosyltransferase involved in cell wall biosynthesis
MSTRLAYLVSRYPAISHTFILREVLALRAKGFEIYPVSINPPDRSMEKMTREEQDEAARTLYVKSAGMGQLLLAHLYTLLRSPLRYLSGLVFALRLGGMDLHAMLFNLFYFVEAVVVGEWMGRKKLKHVHVHFATQAATVAMIAERVFDIEYSITVHGPDEFYEVGRYRLAEKIQAARFLCTIGRYCRSQLMKLSDPSQWSKFEISPLGVNPDLFHPVAVERTERFRILCVGRLVAAKGQAILLQAVQALQRRGEAVELTLVGDGPDRVLLEKTAQELGVAGCVHFAGAVNQDRIGEYYRRADAFVLPSFAEGIPVVLMEAMAMGIPCISTTITGIPELIASGAEGILVPASDFELLAEAIALLKASPEIAARLGEQGRRKVSIDYNLETNTQRLAEIFRRRLHPRATAEIEEQVLA